MGEVNGSLRALLIQSRSGLPSMAREMMSKGMISEEALARIQEVHSQPNGHGGPNGTRAKAR